MSIAPISAITLQLQEQPGWEGVRDWGAIVRAWQASVSSLVAERTQPRSLTRGLLTIATNSASLAHQLTFGRQKLCYQLNLHLDGSIQDLRFVAIGLSSNTSSTATESVSVPIDAGAVVICSQCDTRARQGELLRWGVCQFCAIELGILGKK